MLFNLKEKVVLVTGASGGIGDAIVRVLHKQGAIVIPFSRSPEYAQNLSNELKERIISVNSRNITTEEDCTILIKEVVEKAGKIDILVNNAGITKDTLTLRMKQSDFEEVIKVDLLAPFLLSKAALGNMIKNKWGRIVNIASVVGVNGNPGQANYSSAKGGLITLTKTLAKEFASRNITVNSISPGFIKTKMTDVLTEEQKNNILSSVPLKRMGNANEIAYAVLYLVSEEAGYITGHNLNINGGMLMI